ncbi:MAG: c-type cytochrome [Acidobacteriota bacterium]|nr:c-type cytochrome [Acidobacteriota bacterium]
MRQVLKIAVLTFAAALATVRKFFSGKRSRGEISMPEDAHEEGGETGLKHIFWTTAKYFAAFMVLMTLGGFLIAATGIIPIKASSGHWAVTRWFLQFSKQRSVATHTLGIESPSLNEPRLVLKGAGAYENNCRACHGSPSLQYPRVAQQMTPQPPYLPATIPTWEAEELFYIVKHGIKFTGMPAWPARQRDDEVWAMAAFLQRFPSLKDDEYRRLVSGDLAMSGEAVSIGGLERPEPRIVVTNCARCHGLDGLGRGLGAFPRLAGQQVRYLDLSLQAYAKSERHSGIMGPIAAGLSIDEMSELARYYSGLSKLPPSPTMPEAASAIERGSVIALQGIPARRIPACVACHGPSDITRNPVYPTLAGQYADYLILQLELFKNESRGGTAYAHLMRAFATRLSPDQMRDVALYYASLTSHDLSSQTDKSMLSK